MFKYFSITILIISLLSLLLPQLALAGRFPFGESLVPCGGACKEWSQGMTECLVPEEGVSLARAQPCNLCHVFVLAQNVINGFLIIIFFIGTVMVGIGGFVILTAGGAPEKVTHGKRVITYTIIGLVVASCSWIIINETMILLVGTGTGMGEQKFPWPWNEIDCSDVRHLPIGE